jgi:chromosome segregation ATPase
MFDKYYHTHHHTSNNTEVLEVLKKVSSQLKQIHMTQEQFAAELAAVKEQNEKAKAEIVAKLASLEEAIIAAGNVTPAMEEALASLKTSVQGTDDIVPDVPGE